MTKPPKTTSKPSRIAARKHSAPPKIATPLSDAVEKTRVETGSDRTPAYGDALALCRKLERALAVERKGRTGDVLTREEVFAWMLARGIEAFPHAHDDEFALLSVSKLLEIASAAAMPDSARVCMEAYQVVGSLLSDLGHFESEQGRKILDNLSEARMVHNDVLPWPSFEHAPREEPAPRTSSPPKSAASLGEQVKRARKTVDAWPAEKRALMRLEGFDPFHGRLAAAQPVSAAKKGAGKSRRREE